MNEHSKSAIPVYEPPRIEDRVSLKGHLAPISSGID